MQSEPPAKVETGVGQEPKDPVMMTGSIPVCGEAPLRGSNPEPPCEERAENVVPLTFETLNAHNEHVPLQNEGPVFGPAVYVVDEMVLRQELAQELERQRVYMAQEAGKTVAGVAAYAQHRHDEEMEKLTESAKEEQHAMEIAMIQRERAFANEAAIAAERQIAEFETATQDRNSKSEARVRPAICWWYPMACWNSTCRTTRAVKTYSR